MSSNKFRNYADIMMVLAQKDFKIRYRNSALGFLWSLLNPLAYMITLALVFSFLFHVAVENYAGWLLIGLLIWRFFTVGTSHGLGSIVGNPSLISKVYVPRYIIVLSNNLANLLGATLEFVVLFPLLLVLGVKLSPYVLMLPLVLLAEFGLVFSLSLSLSSLNLRFRDFDQLWDIAIQLGFWLSPIVYYPTLIPDKYQFAYSLNPVTVLIDSARKILLYNQLPSLKEALGLLATIAGLYLVGFLIFHRLERTFAEEL